MSQDSAAVVPGDTLAAQLRQFRAADSLEFVPVPYRWRVDGERQGMADLLARGEVAEVHDTIAAQLVDLARCRAPGDELKGADLDAAIAAIVAGQTLSEYGTWFHLPWSKTLVHVLPEAEFLELRSDRNRHKITTVEQQRLRKLRVGVIGLSVGQAIAVCMAQEGVGGCFRLADFDHLDLSNLNRLRGAVHQIGQHKVVLAGRAMTGMDPYLRVEGWLDGVSDDTLDAFLLGEAGDSRLDLLVEECDDLAMKIRLRERARGLGIPVLMATSERGLLDIERFDMDPTRPPFHGLVQGLDLAAVAAGDEDAKVEFAMQALGLDALSTRGAASLVEMGETLSTWPQLASAVSLGAALATDAARRMALGQLNTSGRFAVDMDDLVADGRAERAVVSGSARPPAVAPSNGLDSLPATSELQALVGALHDGREQELLAALLAFAVQAPTGGNAQPWRFLWQGGHLLCLDDPTIAVPSMDPTRLSVHMALGSAVENLELASRVAGLSCEVAPADSGLGRGWQINFVPCLPAVPALLAEVGQRATNRRPGDGTTLSEAERAALQGAAVERGASLRLAEGPAALSGLGTVFGAADRLRFLSPAMLAEMKTELRWTCQEAASSRDGLDIDTLELGRGEKAALRLLLNAPVMAELGRLGLGRALQKPARKTTATSAAVGLLEMPGRQPADWFGAGRALQRLWLRASSLGLWLHPMATAGFLFDLEKYHDGAGLAAAERAEVRRLEPEFERWLPATGQTRALAFRIFRAPPPSARSLRRPASRRERPFSES